MTAQTLTLASASPRRRDLLAQIGIVPSAIVPADIDEAAHKGEAPRALALRLATEKAAAVSADNFILAADTVVALGRRMLPKAEDSDTAEACLRLLSGRAHQVITGLCVRAPDGRTAARTVLTRVTVKRLTEQEIAAYVDSGEWNGKAGGYGIQGRAAAWIKSISGSYSSVVGLPLYETRALLGGLGWTAP